jgi:RHS repeat-associated protein
MSSSANGNGVFSYDGLGRRISKTWWDSSSMRVTHYVYTASGKLAAEYSSHPVTPGTIYVHADLLGNVRTITGDKPADWPSSSAPVLECYDYLPFGRILRATDNGRDSGCHPANPDYPFNSRIPAKFTGQPRDSETRLDYFGARYYSAAQGRFTSPDPKEFSSKTVANPRAWNRYAYVLNNPLKYVDPDGQDAIAAFFLGERYRDVSTIDALFGKDAASHLKQAWGSFLGEHRTLTRGMSPFPTSKKELGISLASGMLGKFAPVVSTVAAEGAEQTGKIVLGKVDVYEKVGSELGAKVFKIPTHIWDTLTRAEKWAANQKFLDRAIRNGDEIILAEPVQDISKIDGMYRRELDYLIEKGFRLSADGTRMVR